MKILIISHNFYPYIGGIEINTELLADEFYKLNHEVRIVTWSEDHLLDRTFPYPIVRNPSLLELLRQHHWADCIFENNPCLRLAWPAFFLRKKHVIALCTWVRRVDGTVTMTDRLKQWWIKRANSVIAISEAVRLQACPKAVVIGNPYRDTLFVNMRLPRYCDFVFVGRLVSDKGVGIAIKALARLHSMITSEKKPNLTIIGDGPEKNRLVAEVEKDGLTQYVEFTGTLQGEALVGCINKHKYFLVPSLWEEPFGNVALEGMACGCVPIVSDGGGLPDAVGKAGLIFRRNDVEDLTSKMFYLLDDSIQYKAMSEQATEHLKNHKSSLVAKRYLDVLRGDCIIN